MTYITDDIELTIKHLGHITKMITHLKLFINVLAVITSHFKSLNNQFIKHHKTKYILKRRNTRKKKDNELNEEEVEELRDFEFD